MASRIKGITVEIGGDTTGLDTHLGLEDAQNEMIRLEELNRAKEEVAKAAGEQRPVTQKSFRAV